MPPEFGRMAASCSIMALPLRIGKNLGLTGGVQNLNRGYKGEFFGSLAPNLYQKPSKNTVNAGVKVLPYPCSKIEHTFRVQTARKVTF